jgi:uncharacterized protein involved in exopolysaccharide biosynthesis
MKSLSLALVLLLGLALSGCGWNPFHRMYSATAEIQIRPRGVTAILSPSPSGGLDDSAWFENQIKLMQAGDILSPIIQDLKLGQIWAKRFKSDQDALSPNEALDHLRQVLKLEGVRGTNLMKITAYSEVPQEAADIANAVADRYKTVREIEENQRYNRGADALRDQIAQQQVVVDNQKAAVEKADQDFSDESNQQQEDIPGLTADCTKLKSDIDKLLKDGFKEDHPRIISLRAELIIKRQQLKTLSEDSRPTLAADVDHMQQLDLELKQQQSLLDALNIRLRQVIADQQLMESPVRVISRAVAPPE